jgi:hypothetical protein
LQGCRWMIVISVSAVCAGGSCQSKRWREERISFWWKSSAGRMKAEILPKTRPQCWTLTIRKLSTCDNKREAEHQSVFLIRTVRPSWSQCLQTRMPCEHYWSNIHSTKLVQRKSYTSCFVGILFIPTKQRRMNLSARSLPSTPGT